MEDLMTFRVRIGTFSGVAALPAVLKRSRSMIRKLKRRRRPIKDLHLKSFLWLGSILLLVCVCASSYHGPAGYTGQNGITSTAGGVVCVSSYRGPAGYSRQNDITSAARGVFCARSVNHYQNLSFCPALRYLTSTSETGCGHLEQIINKTMRVISRVSYTLPDSSLLHVPTMTRITHLDSTPVSTIVRITHLDSTPVPTMARITHLDSTPVPTMAELTNLDSSTVPKMARITHLDSTPVPTMTRITNLDSTPVSTMARITHLDSTPVSVSTLARITHLDTTPVSTMARLTHLDSTPVSTMARITHLDSTPVPTMTRITNLDSTPVSTLAKITHLDSTPVSTMARITHLDSTPVSTMARITQLDSTPVAKMARITHLDTTPVSTMARLTHLDSTPVSTMARITHLNSTPVSTMARITHLNSTPVSTMARITHHYSSPLPTMARITHLDTLPVPTMTTHLDTTTVHILARITHLDSTPVPTMTRTTHLDSTPVSTMEPALSRFSAGSGTCDFLLGNKGIHSYNGNPETGNRRSEGSPVAGPSRSEGSPVAGPSRSEGSPVAGLSSDSRNHIKELHVQMIHKLNRVVTPNTGDQNIQSEWKFLMQQFKAQGVLLAAEVARLADMFDLFDALMMKDIIDYGQYDRLKIFMSMSDGLLKECLEIIEEFEAKMADERGEPGPPMKRRTDPVTGVMVMDNLAQHAEGLGQNTTAHTGKQDVMLKIVEKYEELDKTVYVTKAMESGKEKIRSENFLSITGVPGSGKTTTMWHIAIYLKNTLGFTVYPILHPAEFEDYFDRTAKQVFLFDDVAGEYNVSNDKLTAWNEHNDRIKPCLSKNTKILTSIRIQLWEDQSLQGRTYVFNDKSHCINLGHAEFKLSESEMKKMLRHYLEINGVHHDERFTWYVDWLSEEFVHMFPLLCKVFSQNSAVRQDPDKFFSDPFEAMTDIFTQIKSQNKHQFCGLVLCSALDLNDDYFSLHSQHELAADKIELRNVVMESLEVKTKELKRVKAALESLDGVYVTRVGDTFQFSHSLFQNIVTYLYNDSMFVFKYGTWQFIHSRVRINKKLETDNDYVLVYNSDRDIKRLADRLVQELKCDTYGTNKEAIAGYPCIDDVRLLSVLIPQLKSVGQEAIDDLLWWCMYTVCEYRHRDTENTDITTWRGGGLLSSLLQLGASCNTLIDEMNVLHWSLYCNCPPVTKYLLQHTDADINCTDSRGRCVLHYAVKNSDMTRYLLSQPHLTCVNQPDCHNRTPLWYVVHGRELYQGTDSCDEYDVPDREELIELYKQKGGIMLDVEEDAWEW